MESLRELYRIGYGPSSSHTMGPRFAAETFKALCPQAQSYNVLLFGSLAATGRGHMTDKCVIQVLGPKTTIDWRPGEIKPFHPNALTIQGLDAAGSVIQEETYYSIGGGKIIKDEDKGKVPEKEVYPTLLSHMSKILRYCDREGMQIWELALKYDDPYIMDYMEEVYAAMKDAIMRGLETEGVLPGGLKLPRKASSFYSHSRDMSGPISHSATAISYALAVSEENAAGGKVVTAPTCGSCGVLPGLLYYFEKVYSISKPKLLRALLTAGIFGDVVKCNGSISGAEVGCQGEVGVACAMASAAGTQLLGGSIYQIEYAAEMGLEHHLGLTCDPMMGLVQIPCIERNAMAALRALNHTSYALLSDGRHRVSFDTIVSVMMETGQALPYLYRETSGAGLAKVKFPDL